MFSKLHRFDDDEHFAPAQTRFAAFQNEALGFGAEYFNNKNLEGTPAQTTTARQINLTSAPTGVGPNNWSARWTATLTPRKSGSTTFYFRADDGCRLFLDGKKIIDEWRDSGATTHSATVDLVAGQKYELRAEYYQGGGDQVAQLTWQEPGTVPYADVTALAKQSDVVVLCLTTRGTEGEGQDRPSMALPNNQDELARQVIAANPRTVVVLNNGTPVNMPWLSSVPALLEAWFPGQEGGRALAQILFGDVNPSGHLPTTLGARREDYPDYGNFPGTNGRVNYAEGIYVGYRSFDKKNIQPLFPFGYGLSYTTFRLANLKLSSPTLAPNGTLTASVQVTNTGQRSGAQVVQLYVRDPNPQVDKPVRELKGFAKVFLNPNQSQTVTMTLSPRDFAWCDTKAKGWRASAGQYEIAVGDSSRNLTQKATVRLANFFEPIPFMRDDVPQVETVDKSDLARGKRAFASSLQNGENVKAEYVVDGDEGTRWSSDFADDQWIAVDLGQKQRIGRVHLSWETAYASAYRIEVSDDGTNWRPVYSTDKGMGSEEDVTFAPVEAQFVRVFCVKRDTKFGSSLYTLEVRAPK